MTPLSSARQRKLAYFAWTAVCVIWGTTYLGIRVSLETMQSRRACAGERSTGAS